MEKSELPARWWAIFGPGDESQLVRSTAMPALQRRQSAVLVEEVRHYDEARKTAELVGSDIKFEPYKVKQFIGGEFELGEIRNLGQLRASLSRIQVALGAWGADSIEIEQFIFHEDVIKIKLR